MWVSLTNVLMTFVPLLLRFPTLLSLMKQLVWLWHTWLANGTCRGGAWAVVSAQGLLNFEKNPECTGWFRDRDGLLLCKQKAHPRMLISSSHCCGFTFYCSLRCLSTKKRGGVCAYICIYTHTGV